MNHSSEATREAGGGATPPEPCEAGAGEVQRRPIRSFVLRQGRMSRAQQRAYAEALPRHGVPFAAHPLDFAQLFGRSAPTVLEIGFGMGDTTAAIAAATPGTNFLCVEVHGPGVGSLLKLIEENALANVRIIQHDAVDVIQHMIPAASLDGVHLFFPDPWPKKRHHKRRLVQPGFVALLATRLKPGGYLHFATDWEEYAGQMLEVLNGDPALANTAPGFAERPAHRPLTKFEKRGLKLGHGVWDLMFRRKT